MHKKRLQSSKSKEEITKSEDVQDIISTKLHAPKIVSTHERVLASSVRLSQFEEVDDYLPGYFFFLTFNYNIFFASFQNTYNIFYFYKFESFCLVNYCFQKCMNESLKK